MFCILTFMNYYHHQCTVKHYNKCWTGNQFGCFTAQNGKMGLIACLLCSFNSSESNSIQFIGSGTHRRFSCPDEATKNLGVIHPSISVRSILCIQSSLLRSILCICGSQGLGLILIADDAKKKIQPLLRENLLGRPARRGQNN